MNCCRTCKINLLLISENTEEHLIKGKKIQGVGLGNIFGDGPIKLRSTGGKKPGDKPQEPPKVQPLPFS